MKMKTPPAKRTYSKLPVWIVEDHHEVVRHIYRAIASRHIPASGVKMVHLDSHPDLLIPVNMPADTVFDKDTLFSELSIENWIMPMVYAGHVSRVAWLHPYWAQQIKEGDHFMSVGKDTSTTTIRVTSTDDYFLSDALYVPADQLLDPKPLSLKVIQVNAVDASQEKHDVPDPKKAKLTATNDKKDHEDQPQGGSSCVCIPQTADGSSMKRKPNCDEQSSSTKTAFPNRLQGFVEPSDQYVLDIDLDFFSCKNPFKEMYTQEEYAILQELYSFRRPRENADEEELSECVERRTRQLEDLESAFAELLEDDDQLTVERWTKNPGMSSLAKLVCSLKSRNESPDYEMVHQAGLTCDYSELPHHVSSDGEIQQLLQAVRLTLEPLPKPTIITVSRSSLDEYCPTEQVDFIQSGIMNVLENLFGPLDVHKEYEVGESSSHASNV